MDTNSKKILNALPEFDKFMDLAEDIKTLSLSKMKLENLIREGEAVTFKLVMTSPEYFVNGKAVPVSYYENAYKFSGIDGKLLELRNKLAEIQADLDRKKSEFEIYRQMHDLFKTLVYQERVMS